MAIFPQGFQNIAARCRNTEDGGAERRVLRQLQRCLEDDYLVWHNVPVGNKGRQPDFVVLHPGRGLLVLEVKGWRAGALHQVSRHDIELNLASGQGRVSKIHPGLQARGYAIELVNQMQRDPGLCQTDGRHAGSLIVPWGCGVVFANIERQRITDPRWDEFFPPATTLTREDLAEELDPAAFQERLWGMFTTEFRLKTALTLPQRDRIRWHLFPEIRLQTQASLLDEDDASGPGCQAAPSPSDALMLVMDLQQEQLARSMGEGHRVIHGVAGSGKTMILVYRAQQLAAAARPDWPILVLCYNRPLAARIDALMRQRGLDERVQVRTFHGWCYDMADTYQLGIPKKGFRPDYDALADRVVEAVAHGRIPRAQYAALMIDEAHDFEDAWLRLAPQLVDPATNSLLVLYDDAQSIYRQPRRKFSFASVGIEARGRTSVLKVNYRNTAEVLKLATATAGQLLRGGEPDGEGDSDIVRQTPLGAGRSGPPPELLRGRTPREEAELIADRLTDALADGVSPADIGILARRHDLLDPVEKALHQRGIRTQRLQRAGTWEPDSVKRLCCTTPPKPSFP
ncbi:DEAD/DEAH box helicase [Sphaerotilus sp.]|uniref:DEAD/DEAH box helicase n=1 Tax=Sphaerotilus sp. TaxID=2093942 RepID=UPI002ACD6822|nr:NERD domain-containing protein [Sphaerotilus sp.]MDZ7857242.1 NERD domain-containing protein [Sphaerotilus sp.]